MKRANPAATVCAIAFVACLAMAVLFLGGRQYKFALGAVVLALASLSFGISEARHAARDARLKRDPFTTDRSGSFPPQRKHPIR